MYFTGTLKFLYISGIESAYMLPQGIIRDAYCAVLKTLLVNRLVGMIFLGGGGGCEREREVQKKKS